MVQVPLINKYSSSSCWVPSMMLETPGRGRERGPCPAALIRMEHKTCTRAASSEKYGLDQTWPYVPRRRRAPLPQSGTRNKGEYGVIQQ